MPAHIKKCCYKHSGTSQCTLPFSPPLPQQVLGGLNHSLYHGTIMFTDIVEQRFYNVLVSNVTIGNISISLDCQEVTMTTIGTQIYVPIVLTCYLLSLCHSFSLPSFPTHPLSSTSLPSPLPLSLSSVSFPPPFPLPPTTQFNNDQSIVDSGTTDIFFPKAVFAEVMEAFAAHFKVWQLAYSLFSLLVLT